MKIIYTKHINKFAIFLIISGFGALWLSFMWHKLVFGSSMGGGGKFAQLEVFYYYLANSILLILSGFILRTKIFKLYSIIGILLGLSVIASLLIFQDGINLFFYTVLLGMTMGTMYGGIILVPMFLISVWINLFRGFKHVFGKLAYSLANEADQNNGNNDSSRA